MRKFWLVMIPLALAVTPIFAQKAPKKDRIPEDLSIKLERTGCFGYCPQYELSVDGSGFLYYRPISVLPSPASTLLPLKPGKARAIKPPKLKSKLSKSDLRDLISEFEKRRFFELNDNYSSTNDGCTSWITDLPGMIISVTYGGRSKRVSFNPGCVGISQETRSTITTLGQKIDSLRTRVKLRTVT